MIKKILFWTAVAFAGYAVIKQPVRSAMAVGGALTEVGQAFGSVIVFLTVLFN